MTTFDSVEFGKRIRKLRKNSDMSQEELASELHITRQFLGRIETGDQRVSVDLMVDMADYFNVSFDYLILGEEPDWNGMRKRLLLVVDELIEIAKCL